MWLCHTLISGAATLHCSCSGPPPPLYAAGLESEYASTVIRIHILLWIVLLGAPSVTAHYLMQCVCFLTEILRFQTC